MTDTKPLRPGRPRKPTTDDPRPTGAPFIVDDSHLPASEFGDRLVPLKVTP